MIQSMTGYGRSEKKSKGTSVVVEIKSVNHRYTDISVRSNRTYSEMEGKIRKKIKENFSRGSFEAYFYIKNEESSQKELKINEDLVKQYTVQAKRLKSKHPIAGELDINTLINLRDIVSFEEKADKIDQVWPLLEKTTDEAIIRLRKMREVEGKTLKKDILDRINTLKTLLTFVEKKRAKAARVVRDNLLEKISLALDKHEMDEKRFTEEVVYLVERSDISEELTRFDNHLKQFKLIVKERNPIGRKLDFLLQEINREANTISSKANDFDISSAAVNIKSELEKIREQVQNIE